LGLVLGKGRSTNYLERHWSIHSISNQPKQSNHGHIFPASNDCHPLPLPASSGALEIAASLGVPTLASWTKRGGRDVRALVCVHPKGERVIQRDESRRD
jgi:hypothetical protein